MIKILGPRNRGEITITKTTLIFRYFFWVIFFWVIFTFGNFCLDCIPVLYQCITRQHSCVSSYFNQPK